MPKRTNTFQSLVKQIYETVAGPDCSVKESAMINDRTASTAREIDILIEAAIAGHSTKIAVECRAHRRPQTVTWIDELVGKYRDIPIDKIVAVSASGFRNNAINKAKKLGIVTMSMRTALEVEWRDFVFTPGFATIDNPQFKLAAILKVIGGTEEELTRHELESEAYIFDEPQGAAKPFLVRHFRQHIVALADHYVSTNMSDIYKTLGDLQRTAEIRVPQTINGLWFSLETGIRIPAEHLVFVSHCMMTTRILQTKHLAFDEVCAMVSQADIPSLDVTLRVIQGRTSDQVRMLIVARDQAPSDS